VRRRRRAIAFAAAAALCAGLAAGAAGRYRAFDASQFGELRPVLVTTRPLPAHRRLGRRALAEAIEVRRVPERFLPADTLDEPSEILGRAPSVTVPPQAYVVASAFQRATRHPQPRPDVGRGEQAVEIAVSGAGTLASAPSGHRVDVVVTSEPGATGAGRTYVAASGVRLLDLRPANGPAVPVGPAQAADSWTATLALTRAQALRLIQAESFARSLRLIGR
jgi:Flp pilus assembly protein CpaB